MSRAAMLVLLLVTACQQAPKTDATPSASAAPPSSATATPAAPKPKPTAWFEGAWQGSFRAELQRIELAVGGVKEWKQDDGKRASGEGKLTLEISADGSVSGKASGALGDLAVTGLAEGDRATLTLASDQPEGFHGTILASQAGAGMQGTLNASSADSLQVRQASVTLSRAAP